MSVKINIQSQRAIFRFVRNAERELNREISSYHQNTDDLLFISEVYIVDLVSFNSYV